MPYTLIDTPKGAKSLVYCGEKEVRIHSAFDPVREAERSVASFDPGKKDFIVITGLGLGYHANLIGQKFPDKKILVLEKDREVVLLARQHNPANLDSLSILISLDDLSSVFEEMDISSFRGFALFTHRPSYSLDPSFYDNFIIEMNKYISSKISDLLTRFEFEEKWAENILLNIPHLFKSGTVQNLFGAFAGYPGVIVSAGPSLKKNARLLESIKDRALVCCVDTSAKVLSRMGISPHLVMTLDAQKHSIRHFLGITDSSPALIADLVSYPKIAARYPGKVLFSTTSKYYNDERGELRRITTPLMDWVEQFVDNIGDIQSGGSVATSLFDFMLNAGCDPIILIGQDLAYTGREIHTSGTYHNDEWLTLVSRTVNLDTINQKVVRKRKIKYLAAWGSKGTVVSDFVLDLYRQWFEDSAAKVHVRVINATEGGAKIHGTEELTLSEVVKTLAPKKFTPARILESVISHSAPKNPGKFINAITAITPALLHLGSLHADNPASIAEAAISLNDPQLAMIFSPFLKKINAYLNRHPDLEKEKAESLIGRDVIRSSEQLVKILRRCKDEITAGGHNVR